MEKLSPAQIESRSMELIRQELAQMGIVLPPETEAVTLRVLHTTADFEYTKTLVFEGDPVARAREALPGGVLLTDTRMALAGISRIGLQKLDAKALCLIGEKEVEERARSTGGTRSEAAVELAASRYPRGIYVVGNAPTALLSLCTQMEQGLRPSLVIAVPVGFVHVVEAKEQILQVCRKFGIPIICARGRKGGSNVAAGICNALLYDAAGLLEPGTRM
jgi:precorrin-8X/cobalt-precorrin-8 methylmutase